MNIEELRHLVSAIAKTDRRTIGRDDIEFWGAMAHEGRWTLAAAMRALVVFRSTRPGEWLEPGHLSQIIRDARRKAAASFVVPDVPEEITGRQYPEWYRAQLAAHVDRVLEAWSAGEPIPEASAELEVNRPGRAALTTGIEASTCPPELREQIERDLANAGRLDRLPPKRAPEAPDPDDERAERREQARAELAELRDRTAGQGETRDGAA